MYNALFGLTQDPFSIAPDPRFLYMSERHREALAHLLYGAQGGGGLVLLTGAVGAGKTTVCRCFVEQLPGSVDLAYVFNPALSVPELLATISDDFGLQVPAGASVKAHVDALNDFLLTRHAEGRSCVLVIDEAQNLAPEVLEQLRLLTNLETDTRKLLQIVLIGQPELRDRLAEPAMEQVAQRVIARYHLEPLAEAETPVYVRHRMAVAGLNGALPFDDAALRRIHRLARGVPRRINLLCDRALLGAYAQQRNTVTVPMVEQAAREVFGDPDATAKAASGPHRRAWTTAGAVAALGLAVAAGWWLQQGVGGKRSAEAMADATVQRAPVEATPAARGAAAAIGTGTGTGAAVDADVPAPLLDAAALVAQPGWPDADAAWRALAPGWGVTAERVTGADVCARLADEGLACHQGEGTLALLRLLDRPLWLTLQLGGAAPTPVPLSALGEREALLLLPGGPVRVSLATLTARWTGDFGTLWRPPPGLAAGARLQPGSAPAQWVQARLSEEQAGALPADASPTLRIQAFQRSQGLAVDGLAGPLTLMQLNRVAAVDEPRLSAASASPPAALQEVN
jgi:general secretion pathway protein A